MSIRADFARGLLVAALSCLGSACRATPPELAPTPVASELAVAAKPSTARVALQTTTALAAAIPGDVAGPPPDARRETCGSASRLLLPGSSAQRPNDDDRVLLDYATFTRSGQPLDSSASHGEPVVESVRNLSAALSCVVKRMSVGESRRVWVPAALQPTNKDEPSLVPVDLTIDITLRKLTQAPHRPTDYAAPPLAAKRTASGLRFQILHRGSGRQHPVANSRVTIFHSGWTNQGVLFESSALEGQPATYLTYELPNGLREGIQLMRVGDKLRFWLPERLAYPGAHRSAPKGPVVFDVELLALD